MAAARPGALPAPRLIVEYASNEDTNFGPTDAEGRNGANARAYGVIHDAISVGWSWYSRFPANAFFTLRQNSRHNSRLVPGLTHIRIWYVNQQSGYGPVLVFAGRIGDPDESGEDVVWTAWNYLTELALSRTGYDVKYPGKKLGTEIVTPEWTRNDATGKFANYGARVTIKGLSRHIFMGTVENPLNAAGTAAMLTEVGSVGFTVNDVPRLLLFYDLTEMGRANTTQNVTMGITRATNPEFFFLKNAGSALTDIRLTFPGNVIDFRYIPGVLDVRNDLATIGANAAGTATEIVQTKQAGTYGFDLFGRRQDTFVIKTMAGYPNIADAADKFGAQKKITQAAVAEATNPTRALRVDVRSQRFEPFNGWDIEDTIRVQIKKGRTNIDARYRLVGIRGTLDDAGMRMQLYLVLPVS